MIKVKPLRAILGRDNKCNVDHMLWSVGVEADGRGRTRSESQYGFPKTVRCSRGIKQNLANPLELKKVALPSSSRVKDNQCSPGMCEGYVFTIKYAGVLKERLNNGNWSEAHTKYIFQQTMQKTFQLMIINFVFNNNPPAPVV